MDEKIISSAQYNKLFNKDDNPLNVDCMYYSFVPLEIEFLESLRKKADIQVSGMKQFCTSLNELNSIQRIELNSSNISEALIDPEFEKEFLSQQMNPYKLSAITAIKHYKYHWWSDEIYDQYRELYE